MIRVNLFSASYAVYVMVLIPLDALIISSQKLSDDCGEGHWFCFICVKLGDFGPHERHEASVMLYSTFSLFIDTCFEESVLRLKIIKK